MIEYLNRHPEKIWEPFIQHIELTLITMVISVAAASLFTLSAMRYERVGRVLQRIFSVIYSVPSLALLALLIPITGLGRTSAVIALVAYNQYLLLINFTSGLREADPAAVEAARGIGMTDWEILTRIRLPLAKKAIFAGIRLAVVSTIGIGTIAAFINAGGLGVLLYEGLRSTHVPKILWGSFLSGGLAIVMNLLLKRIENSL